MATLKAIAQQYAISRATAYAALKAADIDISALRDEDGELTADGIAQVTAVLDNLPSIRQKAADKAYTEQKRLDADTAVFNSRLDGLQRERDELRERAVTAEAQLSAQRLLADGLNAQLAAIEQRHQQELERLERAYSAQVEDLRQQVDRLSQERRRSWWARLRHKD